MARTGKEKESVELTHDEMDLIFAGLENLQKSAAKIGNSAAEIKAEDTAIAASRFGKEVEDLKQKFLHA